MYWSPIHGQAGTTTSLLTMASYVALKTNNKSILLHNQLQHNTVEHYLGVFSANRQDYGIDPLIAEIVNNRLMPNEIHNYAISLLKANRLDCLTGTSHGERTLHKDIIHLFKNLIELSNKFYDNVFVDAHAGMYHKFTEVFMETADIIVVCANQNKFILEDLLKDVPEDCMEKVIVNIGYYDPNTNMTLGNIKRKYKFPEVMGTPYNKKIQMAANLGKLHQFIFENLEAKEYDENFYLMSTLNESYLKLQEFGKKVINR